MIIEHATSGTFIADTDTHTSVAGWNAIYALETTVVNELIGTVISSVAGSFTLSAVKIPAGGCLYGKFTSIDLTSGSVIAYAT